MAFSLTRPSSPVNHPQITQDDDPLVSQSRLDLDMKERPCLVVHLDNEYLCLRGTGNDVEPARLTGHVALYLAESTPIKEITLQFRGKARLPPFTHDSIHLNSSGSTYIVCNHDWSFLEGEKKHSHTLKAGRHFFPFQLQIGGSLPSSVSTNTFGGASVAYKLRANAVRPGLNHNLQAVIPVHILRSFSSEALEYQQTLEIENTWPEKLMYSIMIPHKAWAATDTLTALVKFSPLVKGVGVVTVGTSIHETTRVQARSSAQEYTRVVASVKHEIVGGKAVEMPERARYSGTSGVQSAVNTPAVNSPVTTPAPHANTSGGGYFSLALPTSLEMSTLDEAGPSSRLPMPHLEPTAEQGQDDVVTYLSLNIPSKITPTHSLEPITVSHRLRWNILIMNLDGHTSELRCSLPLHLLDQRLLPEARAHTSATRRLLVGGSEVPPDEEEEIELPSYNAHVRDRVANMYLPEAATMRVTNPWMGSSTSTTPPVVHTPGPVSLSGHTSPLDAHVLSHLPHAPGSGDSTPLDWVNSELLLSMQPRDSPPLGGLPSSHVSSSSNSDSEPTSRAGSRPSSNRPSRRTSRASSPERHHPDAGPASAIPVAGTNETYVHSGNASRNLHGVFNASMKPFTSLAHPHWLSGSRSASHTSLSTLTSMTAVNSELHRQHGRNRPLALPDTNPVLLQRAYTEVPDYDVASRGFIGGVPPLSSTHGLPSYEEAERSQSAPATPALH
ncbi:hypothetical protein DFH07DRAFT_913614 [Mycena maculata]|uniref:Arrestin C-terminal-like domain-containing protein n=1 Tax=Mycena maculata TaxID=230809 RepID=A0AAD7JVV3_9AGAR|nr:hypothetical protein DFH07DRAFT_913614 [Mycena maculata]